MILEEEGTAPSVTRRGRVPAPPEGAPLEVAAVGGNDKEARQMVPRNDAELFAMTVVFTLLRAAALAVASVWAMLTEVTRRAAD